MTIESIALGKFLYFRTTTYLHNSVVRPLAAQHGAAYRLQRFTKLTWLADVRSTPITAPTYLSVQPVSNVCKYEIVTILMQVSICTILFKTVLLMFTLM